MNEQNFCKTCSQNENCRTLYQKLGGAKGPSVVLKVIIALLMPILVFIIVLAVGQSIVKEQIHNKGLQTAVSFLLALSASLIYVLFSKDTSKPPGKNK